MNEGIVPPITAADVKPFKRQMEFTIMQDAAKTLRERGEQYEGKHAENNLATIADFWNVYLNRRRELNSGKNIPLKAADVAHMMIYVKLSRLLSTDNVHHDSKVDIVGYTELINRHTVVGYKEPNDIAGGFHTQLVYTATR